MSTKKKGQRYPEDFKNQIVELYHSGQSVEKLSKKYNISRVPIYKWINDCKVITMADGKTMTNKEIERLKKIQELCMENEILKKAAAIFAKMG